MSSVPNSSSRPAADALGGADEGHAFVFLGTGAGCGVPAFFCDCPACAEAR